ncbi:hypothetical protein CIB84_000979 [Bambusicola thoracicus]|uniref:Uncharacterized protein n=1 Tax=Bambusicola thoracicus TaxID=9083 RepID=A0A2P4TFY4_BAMTH|nr:hypothetical protein CIB84_000979 [Bambusicola thoracicus]
MEAGGPTDLWPSLLCCLRMKASGTSCITQQKQHGFSLLRSFKPENSSAFLKTQRQKSDLHSSPQQSGAYDRKCCKLF